MVILQLWKKLAIATKEYNSKTALLFFLAFFSLTTCLIAQESGQARKQGWFVGVSPYFLGAEIKTTTEHTTLTERYTTVTRTLDATNIGVTHCEHHRSSRGR